MTLFRRRPATMPPERVQALLTHWVAPSRNLSVDQRERLVDLTTDAVHRFRWEAANEFEVTDEMRIAIAGHAALLVLGLDEGIDLYHDVTSVIVHPTTIVRRGASWMGDEFGHLVSDGRDPVIGEAHHRGPVLVSWDAAARQALRPQGGENVVLHEFAHRLDMLDGLSDGTPPIDDDGTLRRWAEVCHRAFDRVRDDHPSVLRAYAGEHPSEFFAVATEVFFTRGTALREDEPDLYGLLRDFYRQDPATRPA